MLVLISNFSETDHVSFSERSFSYTPDARQSVTELASFARHD